MKHYTSKLSTYSDLGTLQTFGFRGEALSSLCALSKFTVTTCLATDAPKGSKLEFETSGKLSSTSVVAAQRGTTVSIEGLFRNLPVRRRELERNIKREWNRVIGVLNQYACIQTGVKITVSQQPTKGKRIVLFSTKGNPTTRENIINVFGAKTLAVLIPLELKLEMEPTTVAPSQRLTGQKDDGNAKEVHIVGHVSRPAHGEGRQTPDRQMFFVNGRPCGLPQFAKVFNEVYKSYNTSQSPFIFADIQLDTHLYDVNVSPDKRTILLHDQTRMLDNLRESLIALFESHDYVVPVSQLSVPKQTPLKRFSIQRQSTEASGSGKDSPAPSKDRVDDGPPSAQPKEELSASDRDGEDDFRKPTSSNGSTARDTQSSNLMSHWTDGSSGKAKGKAVTTLEEDSTRKERYGEKYSNEKQQEEEAKDPTAALEETEDVPEQVIDFRARLQELRNSQTQKTAEDTAHDKPQSQPHIPEPPIPAVSTPARTSDTWTAKVTPSRTLKRTAPEVATITIGNETVTSVIGSPSSKRLRSEEDSAGQSPRRQKPKIKESTSKPSFQGRLAQMFAAQSQSTPRTAGDIEVGTESVEDDDEGEEEEEDMQEEGEGGEEKGEEETSERLFVSDDEDEAIREDTTSPGRGEGEQDSGGIDTPADAAKGSIDEEPPSTDESDGEYVDKYEKEDREDASDPPAEADGEEEEEQARKISEETEKRTQSFIKGPSTKKRKDATFPLRQTLSRVDADRLRSVIADREACLRGPRQQQQSGDGDSAPAINKLDAADAEEKLSLKISKSDFGRMKIVGQFNLGFIIAVRLAAASGETDDDDELFIIDQHATDEKYNFERLQAGTVVQSQRLVQPKTLELTALEEEVVRENLPALEANGFAVEVDDGNDEDGEPGPPVGSRCRLLSLPLSRETTFSLADLEELIALLTEHQSSLPPPTTAASSSTPAGTAAIKGYIPRPSKVRKMFAMRACRSSVMIGKALPAAQMERLVRHMGELDKPWNCPHGRPTMRHLCGLGAWDDAGWKEPGEGDDGVVRPGFGAGPPRSARTNWAAYLRGDGS